MHKTIYIDTDEEIIGIINKIRKESSEEIFLVIPKNSLLTQGIINLKLLKKEVVKMNKQIILVTSDEHSRKIIKRVGFKTKSKSVQDFIGSKDPKNSNNEDLKIQLSENFQPKSKKRVIGSSGFYNKIKHPSNTIDSKNIKMKVSTPNNFGNEHVKNKEFRKKIEESNQIVNQNKSNRIFKPNSSFKQPTNEIRKETIDDFYQNKITREDLINSSIKKPTDKKRFKISNRKRLWFLLLICILIPTAILVFWAFFNWPKMTIELFLKEEHLNTNFDLTICDKKTAEDDCLDGNYKELTIEINEQYAATGEKFSNEKGMSRGIVKIYNNYSSSDQPLIATTRLLSKEGKLFRLVKSVIVPGMEDNKPGFVEAQVIADQTGKSYNIEASEFTIEGFKGNEKYGKFKAISKNPTIGGANDNENKKVKIVTDEDINKAREKTIESFNDKLEDNIKKELDVNENFILTSIEKEIINSDSSYISGEIIDKFNYTVRENIKLITFDKTKFEEVVKNSFKKEAGETKTLGKIKEISFEKDVANYESKKLDLAINAEASYWPELDEAKIKNDLSSKNGSEIEIYLKTLSQIKKALIIYSPSWLSNFPIKNENLTIKSIKE